MHFSRADIFMLSILNILSISDKKNAEIYKSQIQRKRKFGILLNVRVDNIQTDVKG
jgi:hypothetical protein